MILSRRNAGGVTLTLTRDEIVLLSNCLNEALNGFAIEDMERKLGGTREQLDAIFGELNQKYAENHSADSMLQLGSADTKILANAIEVCIAELGPDEFSTRVGYSLQFARTGVRELREVPRDEK